MSRYTADEVTELRKRFAHLTRELNEVLDEIVARVTALNEEMDESDSASSAVTSGSTYRYDDRGTRG